MDFVTSIAEIAVSILANTYSIYGSEIKIADIPRSSDCSLEVVLAGRKIFMLENLYCIA